MSDRTKTRADLAEAVYEQVGLSRNESADLVEAVLDEMMDALVRGENVKISSFGSFSVRQKEIEWDGTRKRVLKFLFCRAKY